MKTPVISYKLTERGREYRGSDRDYSRPENLRKLIAAINGGPVQERVKHGDMIGFYGHWPRARFGLFPPECVVDNASGNVIRIEPATRTIELSAADDGTVHHRQEFLDTDAGKLALNLYQNKVGGFSSAINEHRPDFAGFDYVFEPNFSTNRGYALDSVPIEGTFDAVEDYQQQIAVTLKIFDALRRDHQLALDAIKSLEEERAELYGLLLNGKTLDSLDEGGAVVLAPRESYLSRAGEFRTMKLESFATMDGEGKAQYDPDGFIDRLWA